MYLSQLTKKIILPLVAIVVAAAVFSACSDDDQEAAKGSYALSLAILGTNSTWTYYTIPFEDVMTGTISAASKGVSQDGYYDLAKIDNTIYSIGGLGAVDVVGIRQNASRELEEFGNVSFDQSIADIVKADDNTLVAVEITESVVKFHTIDANTVKVTETFSHAASDINEHPGNISYSGMVVSGNHLFLSYYISQPDDYSTDYTDEAVVAVYSYPEIELVKVIKDDRTGPIGGFNSKCGLIKVENGDVYAVSHSNKANGYSQATKDGAILRIKSGETEFDQTYFFDVEDVTGGKNIAHLKYLSNGRAFAEVNTAAFADQVAWSDSPLKSAVVNFEAKSVTFFDGVPEHRGDNRRLAALVDEQYVYLCVPEGPVDSQVISVYRMNTQDYTSTKGATVQANFVAGFFRY